MSLLTQRREKKELETERRSHSSVFSDRKSEQRRREARHLW